MKKLFLIRGTSGAGKTTFVDSVARLEDEIICNDDFMVNSDGEYEFNHTRLDEVGLKSEAATETAMLKGTKRIFVHNTFTRVSEMEPYFALAKKHGYDLQTIIVENRGDWPSRHGTPESTIEKQRQRFEIKL